MSTIEDTPTPRTDTVRERNRGPWGQHGQQLCRELISLSNGLERELTESRAREVVLREALTKADGAMSTCFDHCYSDGMIHHQTYNSDKMGEATLYVHAALAQPAPLAVPKPIEGALVAKNAAMERALKLGLVVGYHQGWHEGDIGDLGPRFYKLANAAITQL